MSEHLLAPLPLRARVERWLRIDSESKPKIYSGIIEGANITDPSYWLQIAFSAGIAAFGLVLNSPAVIIGAMLISPLMGPIMATGLALAVGDLYLGIKAVVTLLISVVAAIGLSGFLVWLLPFHSLTTEILARTKPNLLDLGIALLSGLAGSVVVCRSGSGGIMALPGVAIAVALMPPLCTMGFGLGSGWNTEIMGGAGLLFLTNLVAIVSSAFLVYLAARMDAPDVRAEIDRSIHLHAESEPLYRILRHTGIASMLGDIGKLRWRVIMLITLLAAVFVPLRTALVQVKRETAARTAVQDVVRNLAVSGALVSQQVRISPEEINVDLVCTEHIDTAKIEDARRTIERRTGSKANITVSEVASKGELAALIERFSRPTPLPPPPPKDFASIQQDLTARVGPAVQALWPNGIPLQTYELGFGPERVTLHLTYESRAPLGDVPAQMLQQALANQLKYPQLGVDLTRVAPQPAAKRAKQ